MFIPETILLRSWIAILLTALYASIIIAAVIVVLRENRNPIRALSWVIALVFLPGVGLVFYLFFGRSLRGMHLISRHNKRKILHEHRPRRINLNCLDLNGDHRGLIKLSHNLCGSPFTVNNNIEIFTEGKEKFLALCEDLRNARKSILLQYYIFLDDATGREVADILIEKAREGVMVKVIYDHVGSFSARNKFFRRMEEAGVETHPFFRVNFPHFANRINWRNHRKIVVIDGKTGYIGGMNIADRYVDGSRRFPVWRDTHLRVTGPAVAALRYSFAVDWSFMGQPLDLDSESAGHAPGPEVSTPPAPQASGLPAAMQLVTSGPTDRWSNVELILLKAIGGARKRVWIQTPYFLPPESMLRALHTAALARVDVRVMLPRMSDSAILTYASRSYISECMRAGIKVYFYTAGMLHAKVVIVDDDFSSVGSANIDFRSFEHNFESNMMIYGPEVNAALRAIFSADMRHCERLRLPRWRHRPIHQKGAESIMRLLSPVL